MRTRSLIVSLFGVALAGGSVFLSKEYLLDTSGAAIAAVQPETVDVLVVREPIEFGQPVEAKHVTTQAWPSQYVPPGAILKMSDILPDAEGEVRRARGKLFPGEVLIAGKLSDFGEKVTLVQKLGDNTRAMAIRVDAVTAVGGFVTPGDYVDILLTQSSGGELSSVTILQNIRVLGIDQSASEDSNTPSVARTITVEVSAEQGQKLALAQKAGTLSLTLRSLTNVEDQPLDKLRLTDLLLEESPVEDGARPAQVVIRRGIASELVPVQIDRGAATN